MTNWLDKKKEEFYAKINVDRAFLNEVPWKTNADSLIWNFIETTLREFSEEVKAKRRDVPHIMHGRENQRIEASLQNEVIDEFEVKIKELLGEDVDGSNTSL